MAEARGAGLSWATAAEYALMLNPCVEGGGDERVPQGVRADVLGDPGAAGHPADDAGGAVPVHLPPVADDEERPLLGRGSQR